MLVHVQLHIMHKEEYLIDNILKIISMLKECGNINVIMKFGGSHHRLEFKVVDTPHAFTALTILVSHYFPTLEIDVR